MRCLAAGLFLILGIYIAKAGEARAQTNDVAAVSGGSEPAAPPPANGGAIARHARAAKQFAVRVFGPPPPSSAIPAYEAAFGFNFVHANAGPSGCGCFPMYGEFAQFAVVPRGGLAAVAEFGRTTANDINGQGHDITLTTYLAGVRYPFKPYKRLASYGEILIGLGHSDTNFAIDSDATNFAYASGGGVNYHVGHGFDLRLLEIDFLGTLIPNGVNDRQNQLRLTSGVVYHFQGPKKPQPQPRSQPHPQPQTPTPQQNASAL